MLMKVKCLKTGYVGITLDKVYDVVRYIYYTDVLMYDKIVIIADGNEEMEYYYREALFKDVTSIYRNEIIDNILS